MKSEKFLSFGLAAAMALASSSTFAVGDAKKGKKVLKNANLAILWK